jgi:peptidoglycan hydrolase-like protein with peptidoglycan-binding domain
VVKKRVRALLLVLGVVAATWATSWVAARRIESPADAAARTAPPAPAPILVPVEERVLSSTVITRGTARFGVPQVISIAPSTLKQEVGLITTLPIRNARIAEGNTLLTASGRPVFVLQGPAPAYRDLTPGITGDDVRQLERALKRLGFDPGPIDGSYDEQTSAAVRDWYTAGGWDPYGATAAQLADLRTLEEDLAEVSKNEIAAKAAAAAATLAVNSVRANAERENRLAAAELASRNQERDQVVLDPRQTATARAAAEARLEEAKAAVVAAQLAGEAAIQDAVDAQRVAELEARLASDRAARRAQALETLQRRIGVQVPLDEVVFLPALPVRVEEVKVVVGDEARGPILSVTDYQLSIDTALALEVAPLVKPGMHVKVDEQALGINVDGVVKFVAPTPGTHGVDGYHIYCEVSVEKTPTPLEGFSLRLTIPVESTQGTVIAVPLSALSLAADGSSRVRVEAENGALEYRVVTPGLSADGYVEVTPVDGTLQAGQLVVVGYNGSENP